MTSKVVGLADLHVSAAPDKIMTIGLGSCVGVTLYDRNLKIGGLVHIMLPYQNNDTKSSPAKYADSGIDLLLREMKKHGCNARSLQAKIAGGANMFSALKNNVHQIGERNTQAVRETLRKNGIPIAHDDTGGTHGRTIELDNATGSLKIKTIGFGEKSV